MKIFSTAQVREADAYTIAHEPVASIDLMERAARAFVRAFVQLYDPSHLVSIVCGTGNNGGDGLAIARLLLADGYQVEVFVVNPTGKDGSPDFETNLTRLAEVHDFFLIRSEVNFPKFAADGVVVDALFGSGLSRPVTGLYARTIEAINGSLAECVAIDVPSGLFADRPTPENSTIIMADHTLTFQFPKLAFFLPDHEHLVGKWQVLDIGLHADFIRKEPTNDFQITRSTVYPWLRKRSRHSHKGTFGRALLISGSYGKMGAAILASRACMRAGVGLLTVHAPECGYVPLQTAVPEAMVLGGAGEAIVRQSPDVEGYNAIGVGPGLGQAPDTAKMLSALFQKAEAPMVLDADALNLLSTHRHLLEAMPRNAILTPHPKELARLTGESVGSWQRLDLQRAFARRYGIVLVAKGAHTTITLPDGRTFFNCTGNPGMATAGSGDVLTGIILGLLAQGLEPHQAAVLGVYLHGRAGDLAARTHGEYAMIASDIIAHQGAAIEQLMAH